ncbi:hypothetical protein [Fibrella forsythiae]|uniref:DUF3311 domain-containing protein n=1 Tax=Fibrella forsythiae TaxID=2817061 RepID=A0ABS3JB24_9BACT|nr:hypothetical protein [Fibrella forsythiae]MBO0947178.1 hypothetical protein [Fibrella forsythiae]
MRTTRLVIICVLSVLLLNEPILSIADRPVLVGGVPVLFVYVLSVWAVTIGLSAWVLHTTRHTDESEQAHE